MNATRLPERPMRCAASVVVLRRRARGGYDVLLVRRAKTAAFMASSYVFPGGVAETADGDDLRVTGLRELFEEVGIALTAEHAASCPVGAETLAAWRALAAAPDGAAVLAQSMATSGVGWKLTAALPWARWITPSLEARRFDALLLVAELPVGQDAVVDEREAVDAVWVAPAEGLVRARELALPPPQLRTLWELARLPSVDDVFAAAHRRSQDLSPILPRFTQTEGQLTLLLPWDPEYVSRGQGDATEWKHHPTWATGRSRFLLTEQGWSHELPPV